MKEFIYSYPTYAKVQDGTASARAYEVDSIHAVGGGSVIDCCRVSSAQAKLDEDIFNMEYGKGQFPSVGIPMGAVVTASGTGSNPTDGNLQNPSDDSERPVNENTKTLVFSFSVPDERDNSYA